MEVHIFLNYVNDMKIWLFTTVIARNYALNLRWPNTVLARAFADANSARAQRFQKTNMPSIERSFYLLNARTICVIFFYNCMKCIDGLSNDAKDPAIFRFCFPKEPSLMQRMRSCRFLTIQSLEFQKKLAKMYCLLNIL